MVVPDSNAKALNPARKRSGSATSSLSETAATFDNNPTEQIDGEANQSIHIGPRTSKGRSLPSQAGPTHAASTSRGADSVV